MRRTGILVFTALLSTALLVGLAVRVVGRRGPENTARKFDQAVRTRDRDQLTSLLTRQARANIADRADDLKITPGDDCGATESEVGRSVREGETAVVPVRPKDTACGDPFRLRMRREDGDWRIYALTVSPPEGPDITIDLEHPEDVVGELFGAIFDGPGRKAMAEALKGVGSALVEAGKGLERAAGELSQAPRASDGERR